MRQLWTLQAADETPPLHSVPAGICSYNHCVSCLKILLALSRLRTRYMQKAGCPRLVGKGVVSLEMPRCWVQPAPGLCCNGRYWWGWAGDVPPWGQAT